MKENHLSTCFRSRVKIVSQLLNSRWG